MGFILLFWLRVDTVILLRTHCFGPTIFQQDAGWRSSIISITAKALLVLFKNCVQEFFQPSTIAAFTKNRNAYFPYLQNHQANYTQIWLEESWNNLSKLSDIPIFDQKWPEFLYTVEFVYNEQACNEIRLIVK